MNIVCKIGELQRSINNFQHLFEKEFKLSLNEGILLIILLQSDTLTSGAIAERMGLSLSHASKIIALVENQDYIFRTLGKKDRRHMYFTLTKLGKIKADEISRSRSIKLSPTLKAALEVENVIQLQN